MNDDEFEAIKRMNIEQVLEAFKEWLQAQANHMLRGAWLFAHAESLGVVIDGIEKNMMHAFRRIGRGDVEPALVVALGNNWDALNAAATLPKAVQKRLAEDPKIPVAVYDRPEKDYINRPLSSMSKKQLGEVIEAGAILTPEQQRRNAGPPSFERKKPDPAIKAAPATNQVQVSNKKIDAGQVRAALSGLSRRPRTILNPDDQTTVKAAREVIDIVKALAIERQISVSEMIWRMIRELGL